MPSRIRRAALEDRPHLLALWERSVRATHEFLTEQDVVGLRPFVAEELASDAYEWWVLELSDGRPGGLLAYATDTIEGLFVDPDVRGNGIGSALVAHAQGMATEALRVDINEQNEAALEFYQRLGFVVTGRSPTDGAGRPFPILRLLRESPSRPAL